MEPQGAGVHVAAAAVDQVAAAVALIAAAAATAEEAQAGRGKKKSWKIRIKLYFYAKSEFQLLIRKCACGVTIFQVEFRIKAIAFLVQPKSSHVRFLLFLQLTSSKQPLSQSIILNLPPSYSDPDIIFCRRRPFWP